MAAAEAATPASQGSGPPLAAAPQPATANLETQQVNNGKAESSRATQRIWIDAQALNEKGVVFYFTNVPTDYTEDALRRDFEKLGTVTSVIIPKKLDKLGQRFGFVRFRAILESIGKTLAKLNETKAGELTLRANVARFPKEADTTTLKMDKPPDTSGKNWKSQEPLTVVVEPTQEETAWLKWCLVGNLRGVSREQIVGKIRENADLACVKVSLLPGTQVLVQAESEVQMEVFMSDQSKWQQSGLVDLRRWSPDAAVHPNDRWLCLSGIPVHCWNHRIFNELMTPIGRLIQVEERSKEYQDFDTVRLLVRKNAPHLPVPNLNLVTKAGTYLIQVHEEPKAWQKALDIALNNQMTQRKETLDDDIWPVLRRPESTPSTLLDQTKGELDARLVQELTEPTMITSLPQLSGQSSDLRKEAEAVPLVVNQNVEEAVSGGDQALNPLLEEGEQHSAMTPEKNLEPLGHTSDSRLDNLSNRYSRRSRKEGQSESGVLVDLISTNAQIEEQTPSKEVTVEPTQRSTGNRLDPLSRIYIKRTKKLSAQEEARIWWVLNQLQIAVPELQDEPQHEPPNEVAY